jgi:hypothetical protein
MSPPGPLFIASRRYFASPLMSRGSDMRLAPRSRRLAGWCLYIAPRARLSRATTIDGDARAPATSAANGFIAAARGIELRFDHMLLHQVDQKYKSPHHVFGGRWPKLRLRQRTRVPRDRGIGTRHRLATIGGVAERVPMSVPGGRVGFTAAPPLARGVKPRSRHKPPQRNHGALCDRGDDQATSYTTVTEGTADQSQGRHPALARRPSFAVIASTRVGGTGANGHNPIVSPERARRQPKTSGISSMSGSQVTP